jgi:hypothetical protein
MWEIFAAIVGQLKQDMQDDDNMSPSQAAQAVDDVLRATVDVPCDPSCC